MENIGQDSQQKPELQLICELLREKLTNYQEIMLETRVKLNIIKMYSEVEDLMEKETKKDIISLLDEINSLLLFFDELNNDSYINLKHLNKIV